MSSSYKDFKTIVGAVYSMDEKERKKLVKLLDCEHPQAKWCARSLLEHLAYEGGDLCVASLALKALKEIE